MGSKGDTNHQGTKTTKPRRIDKPNPLLVLLVFLVFLVLS